MERLHNADKLNKGQERQMLLILSIMMYSVTWYRDEHGRLLVFLRCHWYVRSSRIQRSGLKNLCRVLLRSLSPHLGMVHTRELLAATLAAEVAAHVPRWDAERKWPESSWANERASLEFSCFCKPEAVLGDEASSYYQPGPSWPHPVSKPSIDCLVPALTDSLPNK